MDDMHSGGLEERFGRYCDALDPRGAREALKTKD